MSNDNFFILGNKSKRGDSNVPEPGVTKLHTINSRNATSSADFRISIKIFGFTIWVFFSFLSFGRVVFYLLNV